MKKTIYFLVAVFIGVLLSYLIHALLEIGYLNWAEESGKEIIWTKHLGIGLCALPWYLQYGLLILGFLGGLVLGFWGWRRVYGGKH